MKSAALLGASLIVLGGATLGSAASLHHSPAGATMRVPRASLMLPSIGFIKAHRVFLPQQTGGTVTPTPGTAGPTDTPQPSPTVTPTTGPSYPDPVTLLQKTISVFGLLKTVHFEDITDGEQTGTEKLHIDAIGDATCKGPALLAHVRGADTLEGTSQSRSVNYYLIQFGNKLYTRAATAKGTWKTSKATQATAFGFSTDNPLACPTTSGSGSGGSGGSQQLKDLVTLGPETFHSIKVWHVRATQVTVDQTTGQTSDAALDFYISQDHFLPYGYKVSVVDAKNGVSLTLAQVLTKFGEKLNVKKPTIGSKKP